MSTANLTTEYDEPLVLRLIEKVTIYEDKFTVEFKSGVTMWINNDKNERGNSIITTIKKPHIWFINLTCYCQVIYFIMKSRC